MITVNALQAIYKLLCTSPSTSTLSKQLNAQLMNVRRHFMSLIYGECQTIAVAVLYV